MRTILILALGLTLALAAYAPEDAAPVAPTWPNKFKMTFNESFVYKFLGESGTTGTYYYDWTQEKYRVDRVNGKWDRYCGTAGFALTNTACSQYVVDGHRYIYYPEHNYCCYCCSSSHGCGVLKPTWLEGATYIGQQEEDGQTFNIWDKPGLQHNYYWATTDSEQIMHKIDQQPNDVQTFDVSSYTTEFDGSVFDLPKKCHRSHTCATISTCTAVRLM